MIDIARGVLVGSVLGALGAQYYTLIHGPWQVTVALGGLVVGLSMILMIMGPFRS